MKIAVVFVLYKTPVKELSTIKSQFKKALPGCRFFTWDNTVTNLGYAYGVNQAIKKAINYDPDVYVIANTDIKLPPKLPLTKLNYFDILGFAMEQNKMLFYGGIVDPWYLSGGMNSDKTGNIDFISGSLMVIKESVINTIGSFDERFFMYYEDVDYCLRAKKAGLKIGIDSNVVYKHFEKSKFNPKKNDQLAEAYKLFFEKHSNLVQKMRMKFKNILRP